MRAADQWLGSTDPLAPLLWSLSFMAWILILLGDRASMPHAVLCGSNLTSALAGSVDSVALALRVIGLPALLAGFILMIVAMMAPALGGPIRHLWYRSLARHRWRAVILFALGYLTTWVLACSLFLMGAAALDAFFNAPVIIGILLIASGTAWQMSPTRAACLARCHQRPRLSIFGVAAIVDPLRFGISVATWCVATCWLFMALPFCWPALHIPILAIGTVIIAWERNAEPDANRPKGWSNHRLTPRLMARWINLLGSPLGPFRMR